MDPDAGSESIQVKAARWRDSSNVFLEFLAVMVLAVLAWRRDRSQELGLQAIPTADGALRRAFDSDKNADTEAHAAGAPSFATMDRGGSTTTGTSKDGAAPVPRSNLDNGTTTVIPPAAEGGSRGGDWEDDVARRSSESLLRRVETETIAQQARFDEDVRAAQRMSAAVSKALLATAVLTSILVVAAVVLALVGFIPVAVASGAVSLLPGGGAAILQKQMDRLRRREKELAKEAEANGRILDATQATLMIPDPAARATAIAELSAQLRKRIT